jgi:hypothetical protein
MEAELRKALKGNEPALDSAIRRLRDRANAFKDSRRERDEGTEAAVNRAIMGGASAAQVARMPEFNLLSPETGRKIIEHMDNRAAAVASRSASYSARADAEESRAQRRLTREGTDAALRLSDPEVIASMSRDQIVNLLPTLGAEHTSRLVAKKDAFEKSPEKLVAATIDKQLFDSIALEVGLHPNELKKSEDEKDQLVRLQDHIETVIDQEQRVKGKALSREEKATVMRRELDKKALVDGWFVNTEVPIPLLTPEQLSRTIVKVDGRDFKLSSIPERDLQGIAQEARRKGIRPTPQLIADKWFDLVAQRRSQGIE